MGSQISTLKSKCGVKIDIKFNLRVKLFVFEKEDYLLRNKKSKFNVGNE